MLLRVLTTVAVLLAVSPGGAGAGSQGCQAGTRTLAATSSLETYDDFIEDAGAAPDFCGANFVTNDNESIVMGIHVHNRSAFAAGDFYAVFLDTDRNSATGGPFGAEYRIDFDAASSTLARWSASGFDASTPQASLDKIWLSGLGPVLVIDRAELGNPEGFNFVLASIRGDDIDLAPDTGAWGYDVTPLQLEVASLKLGAARAGKAFAARMVVTRSDFDIPLDEGTIACAARLGGKKLGGAGKFADDAVVCTWRLPKSARGKTLTGSVAVTFQSVQAKRSFSAKVK